MSFTRGAFGSAALPQALQQGDSKHTIPPVLPPVTHQSTTVQLIRAGNWRAQMRNLSPTGLKHSTTCKFLRTCEQVHGWASLKLTSAISLCFHACAASQPAAPLQLGVHTQACPNAGAVCYKVLCKWHAGSTLTRSMKNCQQLSGVSCKPDALTSFRTCPSTRICRRTGTSFRSCPSIKSPQPQPDPLPQRTHSINKVVPVLWCAKVGHLAIGQQVIDVNKEGLLKVGGGQLPVGGGT